MLCSSSSSNPLPGLLRWPLRVATVHPLDCCNVPSELQRSTPWTVGMALPSCNGPPPGLLPCPLRVATVDPLDRCNGPSDLQRSTPGLLQWPLRVATVHPLDCCNGPSELQRSTPWIVAMVSPSCNGPPPGLLTGFCLGVGAGMMEL